MKIISDKPGPVEAKHTIQFATTPRMSTYLVAWLVGDFKCSKGKADGVAIRACSTPDKVKLTRFALDSAKETLRDYNNYFGIKYPLAKLDLVAVPDFEAGAMENYGCITFRETDLLVDNRDGDLNAKKEVAETVAHEMAHLWFGDLVTPAWWDNLWLNEGFATWMETKEAARLHPKWGFERDAAAEMDRTMNSDAGRTTRPIRARVETPAEIEESFDEIAYGKAGAVIAMVENWIGEENFRKGVQAYLAEHAYANATAEDFWNAETQASGLPVDKVMSRFVTQPGVPLVTLANVGANAPVSQRRFFLSQAAAEKSDADAKKYPAWTIPICFAGEGCRLLTPETTTLDLPSNRAAIYANAGDKGYYRTEYSPAQLATIVASAETDLTVPERIGLLGDRWALMRAGKGSVGEILDLTLAVKADPNATVVESALGKIGVIRAQIATDEDRERLDAVVRREFGALYAALGIDGSHSKRGRHDSDLDSEDREELRQTLFEALGRSGDSSVLAEATAITKALFAGQKSADTPLADAAVALTVATGDAAMFDKLLRVATTSSDPDLKEEALRTLTRFQRPELVERTLQLALSDEVRSQDRWELIALLLARRQTQDAAWAFVQQHWAEIEGKATAGSGTRIVEATGAFCTVQRRDEVKSFFAAHPVKSAERTLARSIDSIDDCVEMRAAEEPKLRQWLDAHSEK
jgi:aminopeptidase N/puromycin-sensitive aminopeptidase